MPLDTLSRAPTADGQLLCGNLRLSGKAIAVALVPSGVVHSRAPLYHVFTPGRVSGEADRIGAAWWKKGRKGGSFLLLILDRGSIPQPATLIATPNGDGTYAVSSRRPRKPRAA
ncbi:DUF736 family protein [Parvularcula dongshanensis]|uniref:Uncharacterized protein (DUF736 family) n=1 Tax=Parvularcula dongshanensis TaxID=1173995 RepID=A0A840I124_9PROT|nr:uncharacterized protein (DUF736 family) [Parvularcula dongshanensis]